MISNAAIQRIAYSIQDRTTNHPVSVSLQGMREPAAGNRHIHFYHSPQKTPVRWPLTTYLTDETVGTDACVDIKAE